MDERIVTQTEIPPLPEWAVEIPPPSTADPKQAEPYNAPPLPDWAQEQFPKQTSVSPSIDEYPFKKGCGNLTAEEVNESYELWWKKRIGEEPISIEKVDEATRQRMRFIEEGGPVEPATLGTFAIKAGKQLAETPISIIKGGIAGAKAAIEKPREIIPSMKDAYDYATSQVGQKEMLRAGYENTKGLVTFLPTTFINFVKNPQKQVMEDPVGTVFLMSAIGGGAGALIGKKLRARAIIKPEEIRAAVEEIAPDKAGIAENLEKVKTISEPELKPEPIIDKAAPTIERQAVAEAAPTEFMLE